MIIQDTTTDHHCQVGPWAQEERGLLPGAGQECQEPPDWLPGRPLPHHHHLKLILQTLLGEKKRRETEKEKKEERKKGVNSDLP